MCHCTPGKRTPCCGPQCCGQPGGCRFCTDRLRWDMPGLSLALHAEPPLATIRITGKTRTALGGLPMPPPGTEAIVPHVRLGSGFLEVTLDEADALRVELGKMIDDARRKGIR